MHLLGDLNTGLWQLYSPPDRSRPDREQNNVKGCTEDWLSPSRNELSEYMKCWATWMKDTDGWPNSAYVANNLGFPA